MSFKFSKQDDDGRLPPGELPAELAALGEQLQADAQRLGSVYPACKPPLALMDAMEKSSRRRQLVRRLVLVAAGVAAMLLIAITIQQTVFAPNTISAMDEAEAVPAEAKIATTPAPAKLSLQPMSFRPALADVNGPELEGLLDLLDEQPQAAATISF